MERGKKAQEGSFSGRTVSLLGGLTTQDAITALGALLAAHPGLWPHPSHELQGALCLVASPPAPVSVTLSTGHQGATGVGSGGENHASSLREATLDQSGDQAERCTPGPGGVKALA